MTAYPEDTKWLACVRVDHGRYSTVEHRYPEAPTRGEAIGKAEGNLGPRDHLNGVSLVPAKDYWDTNR